MLKWDNFVTFTMIEVDVVYMFKCCFKVFLQDEVFNVPTALSPKDVIGPIEGDDHQAHGLALAGELMRHAAPHHGKPAWPEPCGRMLDHRRGNGRDC